MRYYNIHECLRKKKENFKSKRNTLTATVEKYYYFQGERKISRQFKVFSLQLSREKT